METPWSGDPEAPEIAVVYKFDMTTVYLVRLIAKAIGQTAAYETDDG